MRVTLAQLEAFVWVARLGKVGEAAEELNLAQPTVSLRLKDLEQALGAKVFLKEGRRLKLTADGLSLLTHANLILGEMDKIRQPVAVDSVRGLLRLGVSETFAFTGLPSLMSRLARDYKALRVEVSVGPSSELVEALGERRLDLAVVVNPQDDARLSIVPLGVQQSTWAASPKLDLPRTVRPRDIFHLDILVNPAPSPNHRQTTAWFAKAGLAPRRLSVCNTVPTVVAHLVAAGVGISILPTRLIEPQLEAGSLVALACQPAIDDAFLCAVRRANETRPAVEAVLDAVRRCLDQSDLLDPV